MVVSNINIVIASSAIMTNAMLVVEERIIEMVAGSEGMLDKGWGILRIGSGMEEGVVVEIGN